MVYRRYTNFAMESQSIYFDGDPYFGKRVTALVPRRGDLLGSIIMEVIHSLGLGRGNIYRQRLDGLQDTQKRGCFIYIG